MINGRPRVVYLAHTLAVGGAEEMVLNLVRHLPAEFERAVVCIDGPGPIGEEVGKAIAQGYTTRTEPYHGYFFKILKGQGPAAPLGQMDFVVNGAMIGGFALVAAPAEYGVTGVKTFMVSRSTLRIMTQPTARITNPIPSVTQSRLPKSNGMRLPPPTLPAVRTAARQHPTAGRPSRVSQPPPP